MPWDCTATFSPQVSVRDCTNQLYGSNQPATCLGQLAAAALALPRPETHACPTSGKQNEEITFPRTVSVRKTARREGSLGAFVTNSGHPVGLGPGTRRGPIKATRSGTATQRDGSGSLRSHFCS